eukprot:jgi/Orpsp1_1/1177529/evm.model.c7180000061803.1
MGVPKLNSFIDKNIPLEMKEWKVDTNIYKTLLEPNIFIENEENIINENNSITTLIVDGNSFFYDIYEDKELNWFPFDNLKYFEIMKKQFCYLLSITNLKKLILVFDGIDNNMKMKKRIDRGERCINVIESLNNDINECDFSEEQIFKYNKKSCPPPLLFKMFLQYLFEIEKRKPEKLEIKFFTYEADSYIAELANNPENNGYVISYDSDFCIYDIPGYINYKSIKFPDDEKIKTIKYKLYTVDLLTEYLNLPKEYLPLFATLCDNDYITINENTYPAYNKQIEHYRWNHTLKNNIKIRKYKCILNLLMDIREEINKENNNGMKRYFKQNSFNNINTIDEKQQSILNKFFEIKRREKQYALENEFRSRIKYSIKQYNLINNTKKIENISNTYINDNIRKKYYEGKIDSTIFNGNYLKYN